MLRGQTECVSEKVMMQVVEEGKEGASRLLSISDSRARVTARTDQLGAMAAVGGSVASVFALGTKLARSIRSLY